jgi:SAM-dependent methyltransferase
MEKPIETANAEQAAKWNKAAGRSWAELGDMLDRVLEPFVPMLLGEIGALDGRRVVDVGCGAGALALAAAERRARSMGVDVSAPLIGTARARARERNLAAEFVEADAQTHRFEAAAFDALVSRFGVMFFADPAAAFANLRSAMRPGAGLACAVWRSAAENDFMTAAERATADILTQLPARTDDSPGQFGLADPRRAEAILADAGWRDVSIRPVDVECRMTETELALYARRMGPVGELLPTLERSVRDEVERRLDSAFRPFVRDSAASFTAACWTVTARA